MWALGGWAISMSLGIVMLDPGPTSIPLVSHASDLVMMYLKGSCYPFQNGHKKGAEMVRHAYLERANKVPDQYHKHQDRYQ